jgi:UDP-N-acetylmuramoylalanine--D-glutamate ligase
MELAGQNVLVLGLGISGCSAARFCAQRGAKVTAADERPRETIQDLERLPAGVDLALGAPFPDLSAFDLVVPSPGIPAERWQGRARRVWGDLELCYQALPIPIIAVTGTNGKSTVVRLIESMAQRAGLRARAAGNLGIPALDLVGQPLDVAILEVSSFQLESVDLFRPRTAVWLNVSPDHLDRHGDLDGYIEAKSRLFARQASGDHAVLNADDTHVHGLHLNSSVERLEFSRTRPIDQGAWLDGRNAIVRRRGKQVVVPIDGSRLTGTHNDDNILAALLALSTLDVDLVAASQALSDFEGLPHRCQRVAELRGVTFIDDSKATNPGAAVRSLSGFAAPVVWIVGGRHKGGDLSSLVETAANHVRHAFLIGEATDVFESALAGRVASDRASSLAEAVQGAAAVATPGDIVLLAPACASFDQFKNFEDRGRQFQSAVAALDSEERRS